MKFLNARSLKNGLGLSKDTWKEKAKGEIFKLKPFCSEQSAFYIHRSWRLYSFLSVGEWLLYCCKYTDKPVGLVRR